MFRIARITLLVLCVLSGFAADHRRELFSESSLGVGPTPEQARVINVLAYGIKADGVTDNAVAINNAIAVLYGVGGGSLYFPAGTYISDTIILRPTVTVVGDGDQATFIKLKAGANHPLMVSYNYQNNVATTETGYCLHDLQLDGNNGSNSSGNLLTLMCTQARLHHMTLTAGATDALVLSAHTANGTNASGSMGNNRFESIRIHHNNGRGIYGHDSGVNILADAKFFGCVIANNGTAGYDQAVLERASGFVFTECRWFSGYQGDLAVANVGGLQILGCHFDLEASEASDTARTYYSVSMGNSTSDEATIISGCHFKITPTIVCATDTYASIYATAANNNLTITSNGFRTDVGVTTRRVFQNSGTSNHNGTFAANSYFNFTMPAELGSGATRLLRSATERRRYFYGGDGSTFANNMLFQPAETDSASRLGVITNGTATFSEYDIYAGSDPDNANYVSLEAAATYVAIKSDKRGTGTTQPLRTVVDGTVVTSSTSSGWNAKVAATFDDNATFGTAGKGVKIKEGSNARMGTSALVAGSVVVSNTSVTASTRIYLTSNADGGAPGWLRVSARTASTSFTITSSSGTDTSTVAWLLVEPSP